MTTLHKQSVKVLYCTIHDCPVDTSFINTPVIAQDGNLHKTVIHIIVSTVCSKCRLWTIVMHGMFKKVQPNEPRSMLQVQFN